VIYTDLRSTFGSGDTTLCHRLPAGARHTGLRSPPSGPPPVCRAAGCPGPLRARLRADHVAILRRPVALRRQDSNLDRRNQNPVTRIINQAFWLVSYFRPFVAVRWSPPSFAGTDVGTGCQDSSSRWDLVSPTAPSCLAGMVSRMSSPPGRRSTASILAISARQAARRAGEVPPDRLP
jgi:hypothetical protein